VTAGREDVEEENEMDLMERANDRRRTSQRDRLEQKLDDTLRDNTRLEQANHLLKAELERDDRERDHIWSTIEKSMSSTGRQGSRLRRMVVFGAGVGAAYVVGAKAGRGRYDEIVARWDRMRGRATEMQDDMQRTVTAKATDVTNEVAGSIERGAAKTGDAIEQRGRQAADSVRSTTKG
jgi:hypothetical protein